LGWLAGCREGRACEKAGQDETQGVTAEILHLGLSNGNSGKTIEIIKPARFIGRYTRKQTFKSDRRAP
jgi:hypothetical protein